MFKTDFKLLKDTGLPDETVRTMELKYRKIEVLELLSDLRLAKNTQEWKLVDAAIETLTKRENALTKTLEN